LSRKYSLGVAIRNYQADEIKKGEKDKARKGEEGKCILSRAVGN